MLDCLPRIKRATARFKARQVTALVDPQKIDRVELEAALQRGGVDLTGTGN